MGVQIYDGKLLLTRKPPLSIESLTEDQIRLLTEDEITTLLEYDASGVGPLAVAVHPDCCCEEKSCACEDIGDINADLGTVNWQYNPTGPAPCAYCNSITGGVKTLTHQYGCTWEYRVEYVCTVPFYGGLDYLVRLSRYGAFSWILYHGLITHGGTLSTWMEAAQYTGTVGESNCDASSSITLTGGHTHGGTCTHVSTPSSVTIVQAP